MGAGKGIFQKLGEVAEGGAVRTGCLELEGEEENQRNQ